MSLSSDAAMKARVSFTVAHGRVTASLCWLGGVALLVAYAWRFRTYTPDDVWITARVARNLVEGHGAVFNVGEAVEAYTTPLWMVFNAGLIAVGFDSAALAAALKVVGVVAMAGALTIALPFARALAMRLSIEEAEAWLIAGAVVVLLGANPEVAVNAVSGMETGLFALWVSLALWTQSSTELDGRWRGAGLWWALAAWTRPEAILLAGVSAALAVLFSQDRPRLLSAMRLDATIFVLMVAAHVSLRWWFYDGELLPNTYWAKRGGTGQSPVVYVRQALWPSVWGVVGVLIALLGWSWRSTDSRKTGRWVGQVLLLLSLPLLMGADWMLGHRFLVPVMPALVSLLVPGWWRSVIRGGRRRLASVTFLVAVVGAVAQLASDVPRIDLSVAATTASNEMLVTASATVCGQGDAPQTLAASDIGRLGYACGATRIIDLAGLADRYIARQPGGHMDHDFDPSYVLDQAPDVVVLSTVTEPTDRGVLLRLAHPVGGRIFTAPGFAERYGQARSSRPGLDLTDNEMAAQRLGANALISGRLGPWRMYRMAIFRRRDGVDAHRLNAAEADDD